MGRRDGRSIESTAVEEDRDPQSAEFREASGVALEHLDLGVDSFGCRIGDPVTDVGEKAGQVNVSQLKVEIDDED
jgi:hypothetical protein